MYDEKTDPRSYRFKTWNIKAGMILIFVLLLLAVVSMIYYYSNAYKIIYYDMLETKYQQLADDNKRIRIIEREYKKVKQENEKIRMVFGYLKNAPEDTTVIEEKKKTAGDEEKKNELVLVEGMKGSILRTGAGSTQQERTIYQDFISSYTSIPSVLPVDSRFFSRGFSDSAWSYHWGIDLVAEKGTPVKATADGWVMVADWNVPYGNTIVLYHGYGYFSIYKHAEFLFVHSGSLVKGGDIIATVGESGSLSTGTHLHFEIWKDGQPVDPIDFFPQLKDAVMIGKPDFITKADTIKHQNIKG
jgi:murein DD-endopeptidase MepM/ murein hydrolase activator NlpD